MAEIKFLKGSLSSWTSKTDVNQDYFYVVNDTTSGSISLYLGNKLLANGADASDISKEITDRIAADQVLTKSIEDLETSLTDKIADEIAAVINGAPEDFDTLKEIAAYIASDTTNAAKMANDITANSNAITAEINRATAAEQANASAIADEKSRAIDAEELLQQQIDTLNGSSHSHDNKDVLDGITSDKILVWDASEQNAKEYADGLAVNYDAAGSAAQSLVDAKAYVDENKLSAAKDSNVVITDNAIGLQWGTF